MLQFQRNRLLTLILLLGPTARALAGADVGPLVRSLWLVQRYGTPAAITPENDQKLKGTLFKALSKEGVLTGAGALMDPSTFDRLAGVDHRLDAEEMRLIWNAQIPEARKRLNPTIVAHADQLTLSFDMIDEGHRAAGATLAGWIAQNYQAGQPLDVTVICTGNSRRSILGSTMGNIAAAYYGMPEIRFHSGGTAPTAFNPRTIASLREIGVVIEPTGAEAPRGEPKTANPIYQVRWGEAGLETTEFSKSYTDPSNPRAGFAALMVCGEADAGCPVVRGATLRVSMPYLDPKIYDDSRFEAAKYAERRDDIGRLLLNVLMRVRNQVAPR